MIFMFASLDPIMHMIGIGSHCYDKQHAIDVKVVGTRLAMRMGNGL